MQWLKDQRLRQKIVKKNRQKTRQNVHQKVFFYKYTKNQFLLLAFCFENFQYVFHIFFSQSHLSTISTTRLKIIQCLSYGERCPGSNGFLRGPLPKMTWVSSQTNVLVKFMYQFWSCMPRLVHLFLFFYILGLVFCYQNFLMIFKVEKI